jgi:hypothetical protein
MNGLSFLLVLSVVAQVPVGPLGSNPAATATVDRDPTAGLTQYGWQINASGELEYLIQIAPEMLPFMTRPNNQKEFQSEIPKELAGRIHRVVVSIGNQVLPRTPSLQEIQRMVPTIASLPPGRIRELEPGTSVVNVNNNNDGLPDFPFASDPQRGMPAGTSDFSSAQAAAPTTPLGSAFLDSARNRPQPNANQPLNTQGSIPMPGDGSLAMPQSTPMDQTFGGQTASPDNRGAASSQGRFADQGRFTDQGRFADTAPAGSDRGFPNPGSFGEFPAATGQNTNPSAGRGGSWQASNGNQNAPPGFDRNGANTAPYPQQTPGSAGGNGFNPPQDRPGLSIADRVRNSDPWPGLVAGNEPVGRPGETRVAAANRDSYPYDSGRFTRDEVSDSALSGNRTAGQRAIETNQGGQNLSQGTADSNFHLFVFFVLSVAVNLWMVHLLRSLYTRYRNLLTSLRSPAP